MYVDTRIGKMNNGAKRGHALEIQNNILDELNSLTYIHILSMRAKEVNKSFIGLQLQVHLL